MCIGAEGSQLGYRAFPEWCVLNSRINARRTRVCAATDVDVHKCLTYTTFSSLSQVVMSKHTGCPSCTVHIPHGSGEMLFSMDVCCESLELLWDTRPANHRSGTAIASCGDSCIGSRDTCCTAGCKTERSSRDQCHPQVIKPSGG